MKKNSILLFLVTLYATFVSANEQDTVSTVKAKAPSFITFNITDGAVFPTNEFVSGEHEIPHYASYSIKYGFSAQGDDWKDYAYGMPYLGIGLYVANFYRRHDDLGVPVSLYFFQGAKLWQSKKRPGITLNYEWNLGASFNWKHYDPFDNPNNIALGSTVNIHVAGNLYFKWKLSNKLDLHAGAGFTHFSNGANSLPNKGLNILSGFVELAYHFNRKELLPDLSGLLTPPPFEKKIEHDLMFLVTSREAKVDTTGTGLPDIYTKRKFKVLGLSYSHMFRNNYRYKWGPSIEATYDESAGISAWRQIHPESGKYYDRVHLGRFSERFSVGISMKGEIMMPAYSMFAHLGYDIIHGSDYDKRFYQILGIKLYLKDNLFGTFGIRANNFGRAQYLYWNLGYTFSHRSKK
ncbi:hypothetical protein D0T50_03020 [Bacteroides sp. 214]|uniref:acyloxyacyl hydrolase n=1 Tax=Bacteroides sp. 214 TaxID=2302935 RepID=UPI0013D16121|nr:acyloxyacyl hydrolase [Bacteroides sp. 214]NDW11859.1 hypothetical protein [Bacteroides sp. 214]